MKRRVAFSGVALASILSVACGSHGGGGGGGSTAVVGFTGPAYVVTDAGGTGTVPLLTAEFRPSTATASVAGCTAGSAVSGSNFATVGFTCPKISADTTYALVVQNGGAKDGAQLVVRVAPDPAGASLVGPASAIDPGTQANFTGAGCAGCSATFAPPMTIDSGNPATGAFTGHLTTNPIATTAVSMLVVDQAGATRTTQVTVTVNQSSIVSFTGPAYVTSNAGGHGNGAVLGAAFNPATAVATVAGCVGLPAVGVDPTLQTFTCAPLVTGTSYTLHLALGSVTQTATVAVQVAADPAGTSLAGPAAGIDPGAQADVSGVGCPGCTITFTPPVVLDSGSLAAAFTGHLATNPVADTTVSMFVANAAGVSFTDEADVVVTQPRIVGFDGSSPVSWLKQPTLTASFTPSTAIASVAGCTPSAGPSGSNPTVESFVCAAIPNFASQEAYSLQLTLGSVTVQSSKVVDAVPPPPEAAVFSTNSPITPGAEATFEAVGCGGCTVRMEPAMTIDGGDTTGVFLAHLTVNPTTTTTVTVFISNAAGDSTTSQATVVVNQPDPTQATLVGPASAIDAGTVAAFSGTGCAGCTVTFTPPMTIDTGSLSAAWTGHLATNPTTATTVSMLVANPAGTTALKQATVTIAMFSTHADYSVGTRPAAIAAGDFDRDGHLDVAIGNQGPSDFSVPGTVTILFGDGTGAFGRRLDLPFAQFAVATGVAVGDVNGDGNDDIVLGGTFQPGGIAVFLGDGLGGFGSEATYGSGAAPFLGITLADMTGDGKLDVLFPDWGSNDWAFFAGSGTGSFATPSTFTQSYRPNALGVGDFNRDGKLDVAVADYNFQFDIWDGNGAGGFTNVQTITLDSLTQAIVSADFNGDGIPDIAETNNTRGMYVMLGSTSGLFSSRAGLVGAQNLPALVTGDFNRDGNQDIAVVDNEGGASRGNVWIALGNGDGSFVTSPLPSFPVSTSPLAITSGDFNEDGVTDLAVVNGGNNTISVLIGH